VDEKKEEDNKEESNEEKKEDQVGQEEYVLPCFSETESEKRERLDRQEKLLEEEAWDDSQPWFYGTVPEGKTRAQIEEELYAAKKLAEQHIVIEDSPQIEDELGSAKKMREHIIIEDSPQIEDELCAAKTPKEKQILIVDSPQKPRSRVPPKRYIYT